MQAPRVNPLVAGLDALSAAPPSGKPNLLGTSLAELERFCVTVGEPRYRAHQIFGAVQNQRVQAFSEVTSLPKRLRQELEDVFTLARPHIDKVEVSQDGTRKYRFVSTDGLAFEAVYIPEVAKGSRTNTLCISSQTGCAVGCKFCFTASLRRNRNLAAAEIVGQVLAVEHDVGALGPHARVTNIVFMGMGEPLLNFDQVVRAASLFIDNRGLDFSSRRVTVSTSGIVPRIYELGALAEELPVQLAISLNATTDAVRTRIMPINKKWPIAELIAALRAYPLPPRRRITIEYVLLGGVNDSADDARRLQRLLAGIPVKVNLLPLNPHERTELSPPDPEVVLRFQRVLRDAGINALLRTPRGQDIAAACGQLGETVASTLAL